VGHVMCGQEFETNLQALGAKGAENRKRRSS